MDDGSPIDPFFRLRQHRYPDGRQAPHKPLLVLIVLGRLRAGETRTRFEEIEALLGGLIARHGPDVARPQPWLPWFHLTSDGVWGLDRPIALSASGSPTRTAVLGTTGSLTPDVRRALTRDESALPRIVDHLLNANVEASAHAAVRAACKL